MDLPLINKRQTPTFESPMRFNVKKEGMKFVTVPKSWKVEADNLLKMRAQDDTILYDHVLKKSRTHNKSYPMHHSKVNKAWHLYEIDLDREQYNHLRIPVNHTVALSAQTFQRRHHPEHNRLGNESKHIAEETSPCVNVMGNVKEYGFQYTHDYKTKPVKMNEHTNTTNVRQNVKKKDIYNHRFTDQINLLDEPLTNVMQNPNLKGCMKTTDLSSILDVKLNDNVSDVVRVQNNISKKHIHRGEHAVTDIKLNDTCQQTLLQPNLKSQYKKTTTNQADVKVLEKTNSTQIQMQAHKNKHEGYHPSHNLDPNYKEVLEDYAPGAYIPTCGKLTLNSSTFLR